MVQATLSSAVASQVGGGLVVLPLSGLGHSHIDALQPLLCVLLVLSFQHVRLVVGEDLKGSRQAAITSLPGYNLQKERQAITFRQGQRAAEAEARGCAHLHALHFAQLNGDILQLIFLWNTGEET